MQNLLKALGPPGCPSLPKRFFEHVPCHQFNLDHSRGLIKSLKYKTEKEKLYFSQMGGEDIAKSMEWIQHQWKKNLQLQFELKPMEDAMYLSQLKTHPPGIFRKGISLDRPTCLAAVEIFKSHHPENLIQLKSPQVDKWIEELRKSSLEPQKKKLCSRISEYLIKEALIIPLGEIHFTMLENLRFTGWSVNEINQLDLTHLKSTR
jgi:oligopeptide transport system substrate-binding protein